MGLQRYMCVACSRRYTSETIPAPKRDGSKTRTMRPCVQCGQETTNPKFCSQSCAATYNNHTHPKREKSSRLCKYCKAVVGEQRLVCDDCLHNQSIKIDWSKKTIGELGRGVKHKSASIVRTAARHIYEQTGRPRVCRRCGYSKHIEICHIQAIKSFPENTLVSVINSLENLIALCPNCHWEFDQGILKIENIPS